MTVGGGERGGTELRREIGGTRRRDSAESSGSEHKPLRRRVTSSRFDIYGDRFSGPQTDQMNRLRK